VCISAVTVGGGYVIVPVMKKRFVDRLGWFSEGEMLEIVAMAQSAPGSLATNTANLVGWRLRGLRGSLAALAGSVLPPMLIIVAISVFYQALQDNRLVAAVLTGLSAGVAALVVDAVIGMLAGLFRSARALPLALCFGAFAAVFLFGVNAVWVLIFCAVFGVLRGLFGSGGGGGSGVDDTAEGDADAPDGPVGGGGTS